MANSENKFDHQIINNRDDYVSLFDNYQENKKEAFQQILDIRKFEIELYWKRTSYFWTVIGSIIAGYFIVLTKQENNLVSNKVLFSLSNLGLIFSVGWYFVNRGSKFWQVNWEKHLDAIEDDVVGPLYKTTLNKEYYRKQFFRLLSPYPFSVSKINHVLNLVLIMFWILLIGDFAVSNLKLNLLNFKNYYSFFSIVSLITIISTYSLFNYTRTGMRSGSQLKTTKINFEKRGLE